MQVVRTGQESLFSPGHSCLVVPWAKKEEIHLFIPLTNMYCAPKVCPAPVLATETRPWIRHKDSSYSQGLHGL